MTPIEREHDRIAGTIDYRQKLGNLTETGESPPSRLRFLIWWCTRSKTAPDAWTRTSKEPMRRAPMMFANTSPRFGKRPETSKIVNELGTIWRALEGGRRWAMDHTPIDSEHHSLHAMADGTRRFRPGSTISWRPWSCLPFEGILQDDILSTGDFTAIPNGTRHIVTPASF